MAKIIANLEALDETSKKVQACYDGVKYVIDDLPKIIASFEGEWESKVKDEFVEKICKLKPDLETLHELFTQYKKELDAYVLAMRQIHHL